MLEEMIFPYMRKLYSLENRINEKDEEIIYLKHSFNNLQKEFTKLKNKNKNTIISN